MKEIVTAEEILREYIDFDDINGNDTVELLPLTIADIMIEFATIHVEAALKKASEKAKTKMEWWTDLGGGEHEEVTVNKNSIKKSYSLDNIK